MAMSLPIKSGKPESCLDAFDIRVFQLDGKAAVQHRGSAYSMLFVIVNSNLPICVCHAFCSLPVSTGVSSFTRQQRPLQRSQPYNRLHLFFHQVSDVSDLDVTRHRYALKINSYTIAVLSCSVVSTLTI